MNLSPNMHVFSRCFIFNIAYIGGYQFTQNWMSNYLAKNYGPVVTTLQPHGCIVMDTMMNYDSRNNSQKIPEQYKQEVSTNTNTNTE